MMAEEPASRELLSVKTRVLNTHIGVKGTHTHTHTNMHTSLTCPRQIALFKESQLLVILTVAFRRD